MKQIYKFLILGAVVIAAIKIFQTQEQIAGSVISRVKTRDPEQIVIAVALTVALGLVAVVSGQALRAAAAKS